MFAAIAALLFLLEALDVQSGKLELLPLGLFCLALHLLIPYTPWRRP